MKISIITPTYRRKNLLVRAVSSVLAQTYQDWEMIIINDSPFDREYDQFVASINDSRIRYFVNDANMGVNYSRNRALEKLSSDSKWVIFLDDDDYFAPDALKTFSNLILTHASVKWFITNRAFKDGSPLTRFPKDESFYNYARDYLILKRCKGDATHCIETKLITEHAITFSKKVKQGEEWFFFYQAGIRVPFFYYDHNSTISDGHDLPNGLNFRKRNIIERLDTIAKLFYEGVPKSLTRKATFSLYLLLHLISFKK
jgi:glycosyltransferase involved in cell wall biosynthesis